MAGFSAAKFPGWQKVADFSAAKSCRARGQTQKKAGNASATEGVGKGRAATVPPGPQGQCWKTPPSTLRSILKKSNQGMLAVTI